MTRLCAFVCALWLAFAPAALASQATLVTPGSPLPMTTLASFLNAAYLSVASHQSGNSAPTNGTGAAAFAGEAWINTTSNPWAVQLTDDGTHWEVIGSINTTNHFFVPAPTLYYIKITGVNFNSANTDTSIPISLPAGISNYNFNVLIITNANHTLVTATFGVFSASGGGGTALIAGGTAITVSGTTANSANNAQRLAGVNTTDYNFSTLFFRVGTAEGAAATADVIIGIEPH